MDDFRLVFAYTLHMGGERASTARQRIAGKICCNCKTPIDAGQWPGGERYCSRCEYRRRVFMQFVLMPNGWRVTFLEEDLKTPLPREMIFQDSIKVIEMALRGGAGKVLADRQAIEHGITLGRGSAWLNLTTEQYEKLNRGARNVRS